MCTGQPHCYGSGVTNKTSPRGKKAAFLPPRTICEPVFHQGKLNFSGKHGMGKDSAVQLQVDEPFDEVVIELEVQFWDEELIEVVNSHVQLRQNHLERLPSHGEKLLAIYLIYASHDFMGLYKVIPQFPTLQRKKSQPIELLLITQTFQS
eukprot:g34197.t1